MFGTSMLPGVSGYMSGGPSYSRERAMQQYQGVAAAATNKIIARVGELDMFVLQCQQQAGRILKRRDDTHDVTQLLFRPNPHYDWSRLAAELVTAYFFGGEYFVWKKRNASGKVVELWPFRPDCMQEVPDPALFLAGWVYTPPGSTQKFGLLPEDVIHVIRVPDPANPRRGLSVIQEQAHAIDTARAIEVYGRAIVKSAGRLDMVLETQATDSAELRRAREVFASMVEETRRNGDRIVAVGAGSKITPLNLSPKDLEFLALAKATREMVAAAIGVPPSVLGWLEDANRSSGESAYAAFNRDTVKPLLSKMRNGFMHGLLAEWPNSNIGAGANAATWQELDFPNPVPDDEVMTAQVAEVYIRRQVMTPNEARAKLGLPPYEGYGDEPITADGTPVSLIVAQAQADLDALNDARAVRHVSGGTRNEAEGQPDPGKADELAAEWRAWVHQLQGPAERRFLRMHNELAREQEAEVIRLLEEHGPRLLDDFQGRHPRSIQGRLTRDTALLDSLLFDAQHWTARFGRRALRLIEEFARRGFQASAAAIGADLKFSTQEAATASWIRSVAFDSYAAHVAQTTLSQLRETLIDGLSRGESIEQLTRRVRAVYRELTTSRARLAARTETTGAVNYGAEQAHEAAKAAGMELEKRWIAARDARTRPDHVQADGKIAAADGTWQIGGETARYPGDPNLSVKQRANCRCAFRSVRVKK